ncbi:hypothetical protein ABPG75_013969 [Micractinium tetrahymenae]
MRRARLVLCLALVAACAAAVAASDLPCPDGLVGETCGTCTTDKACEALSTKDTQYTWCYSNHTFEPDTQSLTYACSTEGTDYETTISRVWAQCHTDIQKCDFHFAIAGNALTCSGLQCSFREGTVSCGYTRCGCDGACPTVQGVSLGYRLERLTGTASLSCEQDQWPSALCTIDIQGLQASSGGFQAYCQAGECRQD